MTTPAKTESEDPTILPVKWGPQDWARLKRAADLLTEREGFKVTPTDIIRSGALRRADEVLAEPEAA